MKRKPQLYLFRIWVYSTVLKNETAAMFFLKKPFLVVKSYSTYNNSMSSPQALVKLSCETCYNSRTALLQVQINILNFMVYPIN